MFNTKRFFQAVGLSILLTIVVSFIIGFLPMLNAELFMIIQLMLSYGSMGYFAVRLNPEAPYTSAYLGAVLISCLNLLMSHYVFNIAVFLNPNGIANSLAFAVIVSLLVAVVSLYVRNRREGAVN